jgi:hypothetical protein
MSNLTDLFAFLGLMPAGKIADDNILHGVYDPTGLKESYAISFAQFKAYANPSDVAAIYDASGEPTFYSTLAAAITAASSGGTISLFADVTENILIDKDLTIIGNGKKINGTITNGVSISNVNLYNLKNTNEDAGTILLDILAGSVFNLDGSIFTNTIGTACILNTGAIIRGGLFFGNVYNSSGVLIQAKAYSVNSTPAIYSDGELLYCYGHNSSTGQGIHAIDGSADHCEGYSASGVGFQIDVGRASHNIGKSDGSVGYFSDSPAFSSFCKGYSTAGAGALVVKGNNIYGYSTGGVGGQVGTVENCVLESTTTYGLNTTAGSRYINLTAKSSAAPSAYLDLSTLSTFVDCKFISTWNNVGGHAVEIDQAINTSVNEFRGCYYETANAAAYALYGGTVEDVKVSNSKYNTTLAISPNLTNTEVRTADAQGNLFII